MKTQATSLLFWISVLLLPTALLGAEDSQDQDQDLGEPSWVPYFNFNAGYDAESRDSVFLGDDSDGDSRRGVARASDAADSGSVFPRKDQCGGDPSGGAAAPAEICRRALTEALYVVFDSSLRWRDVKASQVPELAEKYPRLKTWPVVRGTKAFINRLPESCPFCEKEIRAAAALFDTLRVKNHICCAECMDPNTLQVPRNPALVLFPSPEQSGDSQAYGDKLPFLTEQGVILTQVSDI